MGSTSWEVFTRAFESLSLSPSESWPAVPVRLRRTFRLMRAGASAPHRIEAKYMSHHLCVLPLYPLLMCFTDLVMPAGVSRLAEEKVAMLSWDRADKKLKPLGFDTDDLDYPEIIDERSTTRDTFEHFVALTPQPKVGYIR